MKQRKLGWLKWLLGIVVVLVLGVVILAVAFNEPLPKGETGPEAEQLAQKMVAAVNKAAWDTTGAVSWVFNGTSRHEHLWDKKRHLARVCWPDHEVLVDINQRTGLAYVKGELQEGKDAAKLVDKAWKFWVNDAFWLNPVVKAFDEGTSRQLVQMEDGKTGLMIRYESGGATPGDSYLWELDENGRPLAWKMWVQIIPVGGIRLTWEGWQQLSTGAWVATSHKSGGMNLQLEEVKGAATLAELVPGADPFAGL